MVKRLDMCNLTDDDSEALLLFTRSIARMRIGGDRDADAVAALNELIIEARNIVGQAEGDR